MSAPALARDGGSLLAPRIVRVYVSGTPGTVARTAVTLRELFSRLNLDVVVVEAADETVLKRAPGAARIEAYVDFRTATAPRLVVVDGETWRELERRSLPASASLEMSVEEAAHVLYVAAESALSAAEPRRAADTAPGSAPESSQAGDGAERHTADTVTKGARDTNDVPLRRTAPPAAELAPRADRESAGVRHAEPAPRKPSSDFQSEVSGFGSIVAFDPAHALVGFGGSLDGGVKAGRFRISALASMSVYLPSEVTQGSATAALRAEGARLSAVAAWEATPVFVPFASLGGGADRVTVNAAPPPGAWSAGTESRVDPMLEALLGAKVRFTNRLGAFIAFGTDADLAPHRYVIESNGAAQTFLDLARVRPTAVLGLSMLVAGADRDGGRAGRVAP